MSIPIYLACTAREAPQAAAAGYLPALLGHRLHGRIPALLAAESDAAHDSLLVLQDDAAPTYAPTEVLARLIADYAGDRYAGIVCDFVRPQEAFWTELLRQLDGICTGRRLSLWVTEPYARAAPGAWILISSAQRAGFFRERLRRAAIRYPGRCVLELQPMREQFPLSETVTAVPPSQLFVSDALCCSCGIAANGAAAVLLDSREDLERKLSAAEEAGFRAAIGLFQELRDRYRRQTP